jgi:hypothetical protein
MLQAERTMGSTIGAIGHSTRPHQAFLELLAHYRLEGIADVRRFPGSRRQPQYVEAALRSASTTSRTIGIRRSALGARRPAAGGRRPAAGGDLGQIPLTPPGAMPRFEAMPTILTVRSLPTG